MEIKKSDWIRIFTYFVIATTVSSVFRFQLSEWYKELTLPYGLTAIKYLLEGLGPLVGAIIIFKIFKRKSCITLFGTSVKKSIAMISVPVILFSAFGVKNNLNLDTHYYGFIIGLIMVLYCIFEEVGWRGYLQDEIKELKPSLRYTIVGILWYAWHLTFISQDTTLLNELKMLALFILLSWGIGQIANKTHSASASACFHFLGSLMGFSPLLSNAFDNSTRYIIFGIALSIWIYIVNTWEKKASPQNYMNREKE